MKFTTLNTHYKPGLTLELKSSPGERGGKQIKWKSSEWTRWFVLPRFGSKELTPCWGGHKDRVSFNHFPLLIGHLDRVSFLLNQMGHLDPARTTTHFRCLLLWLQVTWNMNEEGRKWSSNKSANEHEHTLSQVTRWLEWIWDLKMLWSFDLCLGVNSLALVLNENFRRLGCLELWWLEVFIALNHQETVGEGCWRWAHQTGPVHCPVRCHVTQPLGFRSSRPLASLSSCGTGQSGATSDRSCSLSSAPLTLHSDSTAHYSPLLRCQRAFAVDRCAS
jgi:hypothetical protein